MAMLIVSAGGHIEVPAYSHLRLPTVSSAICRCGAVYDNGNIVVPVEYRGLCGRCAIVHGMRVGDCAAPRYPT